VITLLTGAGAGAAAATTYWGWGWAAMMVCVEVQGAVRLNEHVTSTLQYMNTPVLLLHEACTSESLAL
jgi:hypothetical protein